MLDLTKILKNVPIGTKLYSPIFGDVFFNGIINDVTHCIRVITNNNDNNNNTDSFTKDGRYIEHYKGAECMLFPSKEQRDWSKFKIDLPIDTPVMVSDDTIKWLLRYYDSNNEVFCYGHKSDSNVSSIRYFYTIPFDKFDPNNIEESLKYNIVNN